jgi:tubulin polyglutamylase TTLL6/13
MLDERGKPYLIEVNHSPSFQTDTPLDYRVKHGVIKDAMSLIGLNVRQKSYNLR